MKKNNLQSKTTLELQNELRDSFREQFKLRMQKTINPKEVKSSAFKNVRRLIARIKTIIHQKENAL
jgi:ribosomal protein L29